MSNTKKKNHLTFDELRFILIILEQGSQMGLFRGLDKEPAVTLYNKIYDILESEKTKKEKKSSP